MRRALAGWTLRLVGLAIVAYVLAQQVRWRDHLALASGESLSGHVTALPDGGWRVERPDGTVRIVTAAETAPPAHGERSRPPVTWGLRSMARRVGEHPSLVPLVLLLVASTYLLTGWRWWLLVRAADLAMRLQRAWRLTFIGAFFNLAVPGSTGGDVVKAYYAAQQTRRGTRAVVSVFTDRLTGLFGLALLVAVGLALAPARVATGPAGTIVLGVVAAALLGGAVLFEPRVRRLLGLDRLGRLLPFQRVVAEAGAALALYRARPGVLAVTVAAGALNHAVAATVVWILAGVLEVPGVDLGTALLLVPVANLFAAVPLLPGGWGVGELGFAWLFSGVGVPATEAIGLSVVYRLSAVAVSLPGGALWIFWKGRPSRASIRRRVEEATLAVATAPREGPEGEEA